MRVIVLDDSSDVDSAQLGWLAGQLASAKTSGTPAIAVGNADLNAQIEAGDTAAAVVAQVLVDDGASAYFYDSPEENVQKPLRSCGRIDSHVRLGHARLRERGERALRQLPRRERLPARPGQRRRARSAKQSCSRHRAADPEHRRARAGSRRRDPAAPQQDRAVRRARAPPARGRPRRELKPGNRGRPLHPDPLGVRRAGMCEQHSSRVHVHVIEPGHRRLRQGKPRLAQSPHDAAAGTRRSPDLRRTHRRRTDPQGRVGPVLRLQRRARRSSRSARVACPPRCR